MEGLIIGHISFDVFHLSFHMFAECLNDGWLGGKLKVGLHLAS
jgi:hypothetical protein